MAFRSIGQLTVSANSMRTTRRELDGIAACSLGARFFQEQGLKTWVMCMQAAPPLWCFVGKSHDSTPVKVAFGLLQQLAPLSRYWHRGAKSAPAQLLTYQALLSTLDILDCCLKLPSFVSLFQHVAHCGCSTRGPTSPFLGCPSFVRFRPATYMFSGPGLGLKYQSTRDRSFLILSASECRAADLSRCWLKKRR